MLSSNRRHLALTKALSQHGENKQNGISQPHYNIKHNWHLWLPTGAGLLRNEQVTRWNKAATQEDKSSQIDQTTFNVERLVSSIDPSILKMVVLFTRSCRSNIKSINILSSQSYHTLRNFAASIARAYVLLFWTNNQRSMLRCVFWSYMQPVYRGCLPAVCCLYRLWFCLLTNEPQLEICLNIHEPQETSYLRS